jgi:hypothetical protein
MHSGKLIDLARLCAKRPEAKLIEIRARDVGEPSAS